MQFLFGMGDVGSDDELLGEMDKAVNEENIQNYNYAVKSLLDKADHYGKIAFSGSIEQLLEVREDALKYESLLSRINANGSDPILNLEVLKLKNECLLRIRADNDLIKKRISAVEVKPKKAQQPTQSFIALVQYYKGQAITNKNFKEVAILWGIEASSKLYQNYNKRISRATRLGLDGSQTTNKNKIKLFQEVVQFLKDDPIAHQKATQEMNLFIDAYNKLTG